MLYVAAFFLSVSYSHFNMFVPFFYFQVSVLDVIIARGEKWEKSVKICRWNSEHGNLLLG